MPDRRFSLLGHTHENPTSNGNFLVEGEAANRSVIRSVTFEISPGSTPGTNINVDIAPDPGRSWNAPTIAAATNLAASSTSGAYSLNASAAILTVDLTEIVVGVLSSSIPVHDINSSSTTEMYTAVAIAQSNKLDIGLIPRGAVGRVSLLNLMDAGDRADILILFVTSS